MLRKDSYLCLKPSSRIKCPVVNVNVVGDLIAHKVLIKAKKDCRENRWLPLLLKILLYSPHSKQKISKYVSSKIIKHA